MHINQLKEMEVMIIHIRKFHVFAAVVCVLCVSFLFALKAERTTAPASLTDGRDIPIVMYHHITENPKRAGKYVIMKSELEKDLDLIKENGYTTVTVEDLIDYVDGKTVLPEKIIMLTFDDGFESVRELAWPLLKERNMKAVLSVVGSITETYAENKDRNVNYAYLNWDDIRELSQSGDFEIQNHTYDMHSTGAKGRKGLSRKSGESPSDYENALIDDLSRMQELLKNLSGVNATAVAYPYGSYSKETLSIVKELGFKASFVCEERVDRVSPSDKDSLFNLGRFNRPSGKSSEEFFKRLLK